MAVPPKRLPPTEIAAAPQVITTVPIHEAGPERSAEPPNRRICPTTMATANRTGGTVARSAQRHPTRLATRAAPPGPISDGSSHIEVSRAISRGRSRAGNSSATVA